MSWEQRLLGLFEDLEQQAEGLARAGRDAEVEELGRAEYSEVELYSRLHASTGHSVQLTLRGAGLLRGRLARVGSGWCLLSPEGVMAHEWVVCLPSLVSARGLSGRAVPVSARGLVTRLGLGSCLRGLADSGEQLVVHTVEGERRRCRVLRVGADFLEVAIEDGALEVLSFSALAAVRRR